MTMTEINNILRNVGAHDKVYDIIDSLLDENESLKNLLSELYQILGVLDADEVVLDRVIMAINGEEMPEESLLPYTSEIKI